MSNKEDCSSGKDTPFSQTKSRRDFLKKSAIAAPVITSLASKPVWALDQCTVSGMLSGNLSRHDSECGFEGLSPGYWKTHSWPFTAPSKYDLFQSLFTMGTLTAQNDDYGLTLQEVLDQEVRGSGTNWKSTHGLNFHIVAAACNFAYTAYLNENYPNGITASFSTGQYNSWEEVKAAYEEALYQYNNETSNGKPLATLAIALEAELSSSYHQFGE